jgi:hypothetical protein
MSKFWGCANAKDTLNFRLEAHYHQGKKSYDDATTSYFKFQLHHCIPISSMYVPCGVAQQFWVYLLRPCQYMPRALPHPRLHSSPTIFQAPRCDDGGAQKSLRSNSPSDESLAPKCLQLWLAIHSGSLKRLTKTAQPAHFSCFIPFLDIASNNKIKAHHSRRNFRRLLFKKC